MLARWTNLKATLAGAGWNGSCYYDFKPFTALELRQHFGLYILNGLSPSPRVEKKLNPQRKDPVHGNNFAFNSFGPNAECRHRHFKAFLAFQNPAIETPSRSRYPNWKMRPFLKWMNFICRLAWLLEIDYSIDEMTIGFQGMHTDKLQIIYKKEGNGFQADALCQDGYCYQFYFRNDPAPTKYAKEGASPLQARVLQLFNSTVEKHHVCGMDNIYNSARFCKRAFCHPKKVICHGVTRKGMHGLPLCVKQEEVKS